MEKITVWYLVQNGGDGSAYPHFYLTENDAYDREEYEARGDCYEGFGETCCGPIETYVGSNVHKEAVENSEDLKISLEEEKNGKRTI